MHHLEYDRRLVLRPLPGRALGLAAGMGLGTVVLLGGLAVLIASTMRVGGWTRTQLAAAVGIVVALVCVPVLLNFLYRAADRWAFDEEGVTVYRGATVRRRVTWDQVLHVEVLPFCVRLHAGLTTYHLYWGDPRVGRQLVDLWHAHRARAAAEAAERLQSLGRRGVVSGPGTLAPVVPAGPVSS